MKLLSMNLRKEPTAEDLRIAQSNRAREVENQRGYVITLRADCIGTRDNIARLRREADEQEKALTNREQRLKDAESKLSRMERANAA